MQLADSPSTQELRFLSRPLLWLLFGAAVALILGLVATEWWVTRLYNNKEVADKAHQVVIALHFQDEIQRGGLIDYAIWDDAYRAIRFNYIDWQTDNIGSAVSGIGANTELHVIVPNANAASYGWVAGRSNLPNIELLPREIVDGLLGDLSQHSATPPYIAARYVLLDGAVWRFMATRVIPNAGPPEGVEDDDLPRLISGIKVTGGYLTKISDQVLVEDLQVILGPQPDGHADTCQNLIPGENAAWLCWNTARPGDLTLRAAALPILTLAIGLVLALGICLRQILRAARELEIAMLQAQRTNVRKTEFLATVTHELRTPLNGVLGIGEVMRTTSLSPRQREMLEVMIRSGNGLLEMINDLLDVARIESDSMELAVAPVNFQDVLQTVDELLRPEASQRGIALIFQMPNDGFPKILADGRALRQILINMVGNAIKFTEQGQVSIETSVQHSGAYANFEIQIIDTGQGIAPENLSRIFDRFFQEGRSKARQSKGTGLGLAITMALVKLMNGTIEVVSEPGTVSRFRLQLPFLLAKTRPENEGQHTHLL